MGIYYSMKKKIIFVLLIVVFAIGGFLVVSKCFNKTENLTYYKQNLVYDASSHVLEGTETVGFYNYTDNALKELNLHLYANAYKEGAKASVVSLANYEKAYPNGKSYGCVTIESVSHYEEYLTYEIAGEDQNILKVILPELVYPNEFFEFEIGFCVSLANINHRLGYGSSTINLCNYYPIMCVYEDGGFVTDLYNSNGDPFYSKMANYEVKITYPKNLTLASTGSQKNVLDGENKITTITAENVRDFAMVLSQKFENLEANHGGVEIDYYYYGDSTPEDTLKVIKQVLDYNKKYGEYPYKNISVVEANFVHGGMEYPNLVLISDDLIDYQTYINVVVHELCHQWWYGVVGNNQYKYGFLDEGLTDYNTAKFYDAHPEYGVKSKTIFANATSSYATFEKVYADVKKENFSTSMLKSLNEFETENEYVYLSYVKGMLMFAELENVLGAKKLDKCLKYYYQEHMFSEVVPQDLVDCFCKKGNKNLQSFFDSWFNGNVVLREF